MSLLHSSNAFSILKLGVHGNRSSPSFGAGKHSPHLPQEWFNHHPMLLFKAFTVTRGLGRQNICWSWQKVWSQYPGKKFRLPRPEPRAWLHRTGLRAWAVSWFVWRNILVFVSVCVCVFACHSCHTAVVRLPSKYRYTHLNHNGWRSTVVLDDSDDDDASFLGG